MNLKKNLNKRGFRLTKQRQAVMEVVLNTKGKHLSSGEIFEMVKHNHPSIGLATVYRTLPLLEKMNLLSKISLDDGCIRYEALTAKEQGHHHLICIKCGAVYEIKEDLLGVREKEILEQNHFNAANYMVKIYGYCISCIDKDNEI
ncbi:Fur family transcriptional regulator [Cellulosilyticum sp. I15G10I2]|uniref:Fur family transcriptional regulator n=1 Tax=Cellulosilyticum sp. I15G10I2 TaxID=1892843 RepID=UPI0009F5752E|nr:transcriptional repressor [Cellulosilyticum sp. I15G10I2]